MTCFQKVLKQTTDYIFPTIIFVGYPYVKGHRHTQWMLTDVSPLMHQNRFERLFYSNSTAGGNSGSPLYCIDHRSKEALAVGVHTGGSQNLGLKSALPISRHIKTEFTSLPDSLTCTITSNIF